MRNFFDRSFWIGFWLGFWFIVGLWLGGAFR
jgi:hypothetical protein